MKKTISLLLSIFLVISLFSCGGETTTPPKEDPSVSQADLSKMDFSIDEKNGAEWVPVILPEDNMLIEKSGCYSLSGERKNQTLTVNVKKGDVELIFDGLSIINDGAPAVFIKSADNVKITLKDGTKNVLKDGGAFSDMSNGTEIDAVIFSKADLTFSGKGSLEIEANNKHAVVSKDDLVITSGNYGIKAKNVGLSGKDCVKIGGGNIKINAGTDAIRSDNSEDTTKGFVYIQNGNIELISENDGIQAETAVKIDSGNISITSGGGSVSSLSSQADQSCKGIKAVSDIVITGGNIKVDSKDDSIHSNNTVSFLGGTLDITSGDDGIHADTDLLVQSGNITVSKSYEGIEASKIVIENGNIDVTSKDDGINAAGGSDLSSLEQRPGMRPFSRSTGDIYLRGGYIKINASGDGIDSNGTINVSGGVILISGPTDNGNAAFDYETSANLTGGTLIALGSSGMAQNFTYTSGQGAFLLPFNSLSSSDLFSVCDSAGKVIASFAPEKQYNCALVTTPAIKDGEKYSIYVGGTLTNGDKNGFTQDGKLENGTLVTTLTMQGTLYGNGGMGGKGGNRNPGQNPAGDPRQPGQFDPGGGDHGGGHLAVK